MDNEGRGACSGQQQHDASGGPSVTARRAPGRVWGLYRVHGGDGGCARALFRGRRRPRDFGLSLFFVVSVSFENSFNRTMGCGASRWAFGLAGRPDARMVAGCARAIRRVHAWEHNSRRITGSGSPPKTRYDPITVAWTKGRRPHTKFLHLCLESERRRPRLGPTSGSNR